LGALTPKPNPIETIAEQPGHHRITWYIFICKVFTTLLKTPPPCTPPVNTRLCTVSRTITTPIFGCHRHHRFKSSLVRTQIPTHQIHLNEVFPNVLCEKLSEAPQTLLRKSFYCYPFAKLTIPSIYHILSFISSPLDLSSFSVFRPSAHSRG